MADICEWQNVYLVEGIQNLQFAVLYPWDSKFSISVMPHHSDDVIKNWLRNRNTIELLGFWEYIHNPDFKPVKFDGFKKEDHKLIA